MQVILLEKISKLGDSGDLVTVRSGYGRNYLLPQKKAVLALPENIEIYQRRRAELQAAEEARLAAAEARAAAITETRLTVPVKAGEEGKLYGSVGARELVQAAEAAGLAIERQEVRMQDGPIRELGEYQITIHLHPEVDAALMVEVVESQA